MNEMLTGAVARAAGIAEKRIRAYADAGLLPHTRTPDGVRIFPAEAPRLAREIYASRMLRRGRVAG
jgi:DNA-binding transcriptional MerR regulator